MNKDADKTKEQLIVELAELRKKNKVQEDKLKAANQQRDAHNQQLTAGEEKYRMLFQNMLDGFAYHQIVTDENGKAIDYIFMEINDGFEELTGLKREKIIGKKVTEALPGIENDPADWVGKYGKVALSAKELRFEQYSEPLHRWYSVSAYCPKEGYFAAIFEDITERKQTEEELRAANQQLQADEEALKASEERLDLAMMIKGEGIWDWNLVTDQVDFDQRYYTMAGYDPGDFANNLEEFQKRVHPEDVDCVMSTAEQYLAGQIEHYQFEFRFKRKDGSWMWIQARGQIVERDEKGIPLRFIGTHQDITEQKAQMEESARLRTAIEQAPVGIALADENLNLYFCNAAGLGMRGDEKRLVGIPEEEFKNWQVLRLDGEPYDVADLPLVRAFNEKAVIREEFIVKHQDGSEHICDAAAVPVHGENDDVIGSVVIFPDITERKQSEERIEHLNRVLRVIRDVNQLIVRERSPQALIQQACTILVEHRSYLGAMIILTDDEGRPRTYAQVGMAEDFQPLAERLDQGILPPCCENARAHAGDGVYLVADRVAVCGDCPMADSYAQTHSMCMPLRYGDEFLGFLVVPVEHLRAVDAEEQSLFAEMAGDIAFALHSIATEVARHESDHALRAMFEGATDGILLAETETRRFVNANQTMCRMLGYSMEEVRNLSVDDIHPAESLPDVVDAFKKLLRGEMTLAPQIPVKRKDGSVFFAEIGAAPLTLRGRSHVFGIFRDITERRAMESQLVQAQKMESVGRLAGGVAHDFNNLLMGVMGYTDLTLTAIDPDHRAREWLEDIKTELERSANLTNQLLAFARKQTIAPKVLDLNESVEEMLKMLRRLIGEDINLAWQPCSNPGRIKIDPGQVDQVLANLCVNARDAVDGVGRITIETDQVIIDEAYCAKHAEAVPGRYILLAVSDDGCGMDRDTLDHVFEPFFTTKKTGEGTGLGLATVYGIVKQNEGFVNVYSEPDEGTTFRIYLPCFEDEIEDKERAESGDAPEGGSETILLVEDEKSIRVTMALFLEELGYNVLVGETPQAAIEKVAELDCGIDLLVTDVVMPGMNGRDLAEKLVEDFRSMKVLYMSGYTANVIAHRGVLEEGMQLLSKPVGRDELAHKVREVLSSEK